MDNAKVKGVAVLAAKMDLPNSDDTRFEQSRLMTTPKGKVNEMLCVCRQYIFVEISGKDQEKLAHLDLPTET